MELEDAVKQALSAIYRVEVKNNTGVAEHVQEVAYAIPVSYLLRLADLTGAMLPDRLGELFKATRNADGLNYPTSKDFHFPEGVFTWKDKK